MKRWLLAVALAGATLLPSLVQAQLPPLFTPSSGGNPTTTGVITTSAPSGNSPIIPFAGGVSNCTVVASDTVAGTSVTVNGTSMVNPTIGSQWFPNPNFGTSGVISVGTSATSTPGNVANFPGGFYLSWSGNTGTLNLYGSCSTAVAKRVAPTPPPTPTPGPTPTPVPTAGPELTTSTGNVNVTTPLTALAYAQLGTTQTITTPLSHGPLGTWFLTVTMHGSVSGNTAQPMFTCLGSTTAGYTVLDAMTTGNNTCVVGATGLVGTAFSGSPAFATAGGSGNNANGATQIVVSHLSVPSNFTFSAGCFVASTLATGFTYYGYCCIQAVPV